MVNHASQSSISLCLHMSAPMVNYWVIVVDVPPGLLTRLSLRHEGTPPVMASVLP